MPALRGTNPRYFVSIVVEGSEDGQSLPVRRVVVDESGHEHDARFFADKLAKLAAVITDILEENH